VAPTSTGDTRIQGALHSITSSARASSVGDFEAERIKRFMVQLR